MNTYPLPLRSIEHTEAMLKCARKNLAEKGHAWFKASRSEGIAKVFVFGTVGLFSSENEAVEEFKAAIGDCPDVELEIDSIGGSGRVAFALYDFLKVKNTVCRIVGNCASAAVILAMASKSITIAENGRVGLHSTRITAYGGASQLRAAAIECEKMDNRFKEILWPRLKGRLRMPLDLDGCFQLSPRIFNAYDAVKFGLADSVIPETELRAESTKGIN